MLNNTPNQCITLAFEGSEIIKNNDKEYFVLTFYDSDKNKTIIKEMEINEHVDEKLDIRYCNKLVNNALRETRNVLYHEKCYGDNKENEYSFTQTIKSHRHREPFKYNEMLVECIKSFN